MRMRSSKDFNLASPRPPGAAHRYSPPRMPRRMMNLDLLDPARYCRMASRYFYGSSGNCVLEGSRSGRFDSISFFPINAFHVFQPPRKTLVLGRFLVFGEFFQNIPSGFSRSFLGSAKKRRKRHAVFAGVSTLFGANYCRMGFCVERFFGGLF